MAYSNLKAEMARKDITIESMAQMLGIHRNSVANKLNGASSFSIEEAMKIRATSSRILSISICLHLIEEGSDGNEKV